MNPWWKSSLAILLLAVTAAGCGEGTTETGVQTIRHNFSYVPHAGAPQINSIHIAGSFNNWNTTVRPMTQQQNGTWEASVELAPGRYEYKYVFVGDQWPQNMCNDDVGGDPGNNGRVDPNVTDCTDDGFGGENAVLVIP